MSTEITTGRRHAAIALVAVWAVGTVIAFWWFEFRNLRAFLPEEAVMFRSEQLGHDLALQLEGTPREGPLLVHFWDPGCPCARFATPHLREIMDRYQAQGVRFVVLTPGTVREEEAREVFGADAEIRMAGPLNPLSSPAAALLDTDGHLAYFGPYSEGAGCTAADGGFVETVLDQLQTGQNPRQINTLAVGCFCRWPTTDPV